jgi:hypothetical protein
MLLLLSVLRLWISPIATSLWLDETIAYWSACKGVAAALTRSQFWPGQNFAYALRLSRYGLAGKVSLFSGFLRFLRRYSQPGCCTGLEHDYLIKKQGY